MTAVSLFDTLSRRSDGPQTDVPQPAPQLATLAGELVEACLIDWKRITHYEAEFASSAWNAQSLDVERSVHAMFSQWAAEADEVRARAAQLMASGFAIPKLKLLEDALGRTRAQLKLSPETIAKAMDDVAQGNVTPAKELRDELRARLRS